MHINMFAVNFYITYGVYTEKRPTYSKTVKYISFFTSDLSKRAQFIIKKVVEKVKISR